MDDLATTEVSVVLGFPMLNAWKKMPPKMLKTVLNTYLPTMAEGAFETLGPKEIEIVYATVSAANNCEMCLS